MNGGNQNNEKRRKFLLFLLLSYQNWFGHCLQFTYFGYGFESTGWFSSPERSGRQWCSIYLHDRGHNHQLEIKEMESYSNDYPDSIGDGGLHNLEYFSTPRFVANVATMV